MRFARIPSTYARDRCDARQAQTTIVMKRSMGSGFAGIENDLFYHERTQMLFGDAKASLTTLISEIKQEMGAGV